MKLRLLAATLSTLGLALTAHAGSTVTGVIVVPYEGQRSTSIALVQPADYVCATVTISSREKDPVRQADEVRSTVNLLSTTVAKTPRLQLHQGPLRFFSTGGSGKLFSSTSYGGSSQLSTSVRILYKLDDPEHDSFAASVAVRKLIDELKTPPQTDIRITSVTLAVDSPERQRERLLSLIRESSEAMKKTFNATEVTIGGLDGAVLVRQVDDASVELFIDYQLSVTTK
jgi:hypothetical protein